jgi:hypothetical protein
MNVYKFLLARVQYYPFRSIPFCLLHISDKCRRKILNKLPYYAIYWSCKGIYLYCR